MMAAKPLFKRLLDAGMQFSEMSQQSAEKLVSDFVKAGEIRRKDAERTVGLLVERGRSSTEQVLASVQSEVSKQLGRFAEQIDDIEDRLEDLAERMGMRSKSSAGATPSGGAAKKAPAKKAPAKKAPAKKAPAKKTAAKKTAAKKAPVKKAAVKKAAVKKAAG
jgi:polyhydroxyalkanoate synthesis regulator phasin